MTDNNIFEVTLVYYGTREELNKWINEDPISVYVISIEMVEPEEPPLLTKLSVLLKHRIKTIMNLFR